MQTSKTPSSLITRDLVGITLAFAASLIAACFLFQDLFWLRSQSFLWHHDGEVLFENVFTLITFFFQGGIQLFDRFDGINFAFAHLTSGLYTFSTVVTACVYMLFYPFFDHPGEAYHHTFSVIYHAANMLVRTVGGYVLLRKFALNRPVIITALVLMNTTLSTTMYFGLLTDNLYSYFPFLAYFILNFFEHFRLRDGLCALLVFVICTANSPLFALGYFYEPVHFLIVCALIMAVWECVRGRRALPRLQWSADGIKKCALVFMICALIMAPWLMFAKSLNTDFYVAGSGLGETHGRINSAFNPKKYFSPKQETLIPVKELPSKAIDFTNDWWEKSWIFLGAGTLALAFLGILCGQRRERWIFGGSVALIILSNTALNPSSPWSLAHWINALTNPFSFLLRSYHMPILLMPYVIFPLCAFGLQVIWDLLRQQSPSLWRRIAGAVLFGGIMAWAWHLPLPLKGYALTVSAAMFILCVWSNRWSVLIVLCIVLAADAWAVQKYYVTNQYYGRYFCWDDGRHVVPRVFKGFEDTRNLIVEYQDPSTLPWREYVRVVPIQDTVPIMYSSQSHHGIFLKYISLDRYFLEPNIYKPRPLLFKNVQDDLPTIKALLAEPRLVIFSAITPDGPVQNLGRRLDKFSFDFKDAHVRTRKGIEEYQWRLPNKFPGYITTALFTNDKESLRVLIDGKMFLPVQGALTEAMTFDVGNVRRGYLTVALSPQVTYAGKLDLLYSRSNEVVDVWQNTQDKLGFTFRASQDGWLKIRYPFDPKWHVQVDGKSVAIEKIDKYFIGIKLASGEHKILMSYWPDSPLRLLILISVLLTFASLFWLVRQALLGLPPEKTTAQAPVK